jgi:hypothetical protein
MAVRMRGATMKSKALLQVKKAEEELVVRAVSEDGP